MRKREKELMTQSKQQQKQGSKAHFLVETTFCVFYEDPIQVHVFSVNVGKQNTYHIFLILETRYPA